MGYDKNFYSISQRILGYTNVLKKAGLKAALYDDASTPEAVGRIVRPWIPAKDRAFCCVFSEQCHNLARLLGVVGFSNWPCPAGSGKYRPES
jgi:hypothetical protein